MLGTRLATRVQSLHPRSPFAHAHALTHRSASAASHGVHASDSPLGARVKAKAQLFVAAEQLRSLPEYQALDAAAPPGWYSRAEGRSSGSAADAARLIDICGSIPSGSRNMFLEAALRRAVSAAESSGDYVAGRARLAALANRCDAAAGREGADLDALDGYARADIAEALLARARLHIAGATPALGGLALADAAACLARSSAASGVADELEYATAKGDVSAVAALLPNALVHARAHALAVLVNKLQAGISTAADARTPPPAETDSTAPTVTVSPEEQHLEQVVRACQAADEAILRVVTPGGETDAVARGLRTAQYVHARTAIIRADVRRNLAAIHLWTACAHMTAAGGAGGSGMPVSSQLALAHLSAAHEHLTTGLDKVNDATKQFKSVSDASREGGQRGAPPPALSDAWRRLGWDLRSSRADIAACVAEVGTLLALWTVWMPGALAPGASRGSSLFPLPENEADAIKPVITAASSAAEAALREYEAMDVAYAAGAGAGMLQADHGLDPGAGTGRALRVIAVLQHVGAKAVTAEGLLRAALDRYAHVAGVADEPLGSMQGGGAPSTSTGSLGGIDASMRGWRALPSLAQAQLAGVLLPYAALLRQWDKREREAERLGEHGYTLLAGACAPFRLPCPLPTGDARVDYVASQAAVAAMAAVHVGSWGLVLPLDWTTA
jgi:hypothetical protein